MRRVIAGVVCLQLVVLASLAGTTPASAHDIWCTGASMFVSQTEPDAVYADRYVHDCTDTVSHTLWITMSWTSGGVTFPDYARDDANPGNGKCQGTVACTVAIFAENLPDGWYQIVSGGSFTKAGHTATVWPTEGQSFTVSNGLVVPSVDSTFDAPRKMETGSIR